MEKIISKVKPDIRYLNDMGKVLYDKKWLKSQKENFELYYMYRGIKEKDGLRYDITIIPGKILGKEFVKTKGHKHIGNFRELYIILEGRAIYLMQKYENGKIEDVYKVLAKKGDIILIPSNYGHVTINPSRKTLKMANWISKKCKSCYDLFEKKQGACYLAIARKSAPYRLALSKKGGTGAEPKIEWIKNKNYKNIPKLRIEKSLRKLPRNLDFLKAKPGW